MKQGQYSWQYYHNENAWPIVHAFSINSTDMNAHPILKQKLKEVADVEFNNHLRGGIINIKNEADSSWLVAAQKLGYRYAMVWFDGAWPSGHGFNDKCLEEIDRLNANFENWIVAGNIDNMEQRFAYFTRNVIFINIAAWRDAGEPDPSEAIFDQKYWGKKSAHPEDFGKGVMKMIELAKREGTLRDLYERWWNNYIDGTEEYKDFEDSLYAIDGFGPVMTALWQEFNPSPEITSEHFNRIHGGKFGNPLLTYSLRQDISVPGISDVFMESLNYLRPQLGAAELTKAIQGEEYDDKETSFQANRVIRNMFNPTSPIYFVNTEPSQPHTAENIEGTGFDQYVGATAGFKLFYYAYKYGFDMNTKFIMYDFDPLSCKFKEDMFLNWDGNDYPKFIDEWMMSNPGANASLLGLARVRWPMVVDQFGGHGEWQKFWQRLRRSDWQVVQTDLIYGHDKLFDELNNKRTFLWTSNIYSYIIPKILSKPFKLEESFISLVTKLNNLHDDCWFSGTDINDNDIMCPSRAIISTTNNDGIGFEQ